MFQSRQLWQSGNQVSRELFVVISNDARVDSNRGGQQVEIEIAQQSQVALAFKKRSLFKGLYGFRWKTKGIIGGCPNVLHQVFFDVVIFVELFVVTIGNRKIFNIIRHGCFFYFPCPFFSYIDKTNALPFGIVCCVFTVFIDLFGILKQHILELRVVFGVSKLFRNGITHWDLNAPILRHQLSDIYVSRHSVLFDIFLTSFIDTLFYISKAHGLYASRQSNICQLSKIGIGSQNRSPTTLVVKASYPQFVEPDFSTLIGFGNVFNTQNDGFDVGEVWTSFDSHPLDCFFVFDRQRIQLIEIGSTKRPITFDFEFGQSFQIYFKTVGCWPNSVRRKTAK